YICTLSPSYLDPHNFHIAKSAMGESLLRTDDLHKLKEGEIFTDIESGKKYRVKKTILPHYSSAGPFGIGDPDDRTLRRIEADVIIPNRMNSLVEKVECSERYIDLVECLRKDGAVWGLRSCRDILAIFNKCKAEKFHDPSFRERVTEEYLNERS
uniref:COX assembly mitochondrial protein n=1 Tax=Parascaris univalens TaxID=6257 RepID=A0A915A8L1_PARUN